MTALQFEKGLDRQAVLFDEEAQGLSRGTNIKFQLRVALPRYSLIPAPVCQAHTEKFFQYLYNKEGKLCFTLNELFQ